MTIHAILLKRDTRYVIMLVKSTTTRWVRDCRSDNELDIRGMCGSKFVWDAFASGLQLISEGGDSTTGGTELEDAAAADLGTDLGGGATRTSTISNRASPATMTDRALGLTLADFFSCWLSSMTRTSRQTYHV
jgi:hypothetical protein